MEASALDRSARRFAERGIVTATHYHQLAVLFRQQLLFKYTLTDTGTVARYGGWALEAWPDEELLTDDSALADHVERVAEYIKECRRIESITDLRFAA